MQQPRPRGEGGAAATNRPDSRRALFDGDSARGGTLLAGGHSAGGAASHERHSIPSSGSLSSILAPLVESVRTDTPPGGSNSEWTDMLEGLAPFFRERRYPSGGLIFRKGALAHALYFITSGEVTLWAPHLDSDSSEGPGSGSLTDAHLGRRLVRYVDGGIFGELDFFLRHPRSFTAVASSMDHTVIQVLTRDALQSMQSKAPQLVSGDHSLRTTCTRCLASALSPPLSRLLSTSPSLLNLSDSRTLSDASQAAALEHALLKYLSYQVNSKLGLSDGVRDVHD